MTRQCEELRELLSAYRDDELSAEDARRVAAHVAGCAACAAVLARDAEIEQMIAESGVARTSGEWDALATRAERAIESEPARAGQSAVPAPGVRARVFTPRRLVFGGLGTIAVAMLLLLMYPWPEKPAPPVGPSRSLEVSSAPRSVAPAPEAAPPEAAPEERLRALGYVGDRRAEERDAAGSSRAEPPAGKEHGPETGALAKTEPAVPTPASPGGGETSRSRARALAGAEPVPPLEPPPAADDLAAAEIARESVAPEPVKVSVASPPPEPPERPLRTEGPSFEPAPPAGGATSEAAVAEWLGADAGAGAGRGRVTYMEAKREAPPPAERALARATTLVAQGDRERGRAGLVLLTGDFPENTVRERAWVRLLDLDADTAFGTRRPEVILPIARSIDAFLEAYPESESAESIRDRQVRVWARLAEIDPTYCAAALERAAAWEESLGNWIPFETRMVVARMRDGPCRE